MENDKQKTRKRGIFERIMGGRIFEVFTKNALLMGLIVVYCFIYVGNRYQYEQEIVKIDKLRKRRNEIRNNLLIVRSEYAENCRLSKIEKALPDFKAYEHDKKWKPPYRIDKND